MKVLIEILHVLSLLGVLYLAIFTLVTGTPVNYLAGSFLYMYMFLKNMVVYLESKYSE